MSQNPRGLLSWQGGRGNFLFLSWQGGRGNVLFLFNGSCFFVFLLFFFFGLGNIGGLNYVKPALKCLLN